MGQVTWPVLGVIFDLDGTLINTHDLQYDFHKFIGMHPGFGAMDAFPDDGEEFWKEYNAAYAKGGLSGLYGRYGRITPENFDELYPAIDDAYAPFIRNFKFRGPVTVGVGDDTMAKAVRIIWERGCLSEKRDTRLRLAVNTTKEKRNAQALLERAEIWQYFDTSVTYDDVVRFAANGEAKKKGVRNLPQDYKELRKFLSNGVLKSIEKPNAISSMLTLYRMGNLPADQVVVVEDTPSGVMAAKDIVMPYGMANMYVIGTTLGYEKSAQALLDAGADEIAPLPSDVVKILDRLGAFS